jgi:hypothetical protein
MVFKIAAEFLKEAGKATAARGRGAAAAHHNAAGQIGRSFQFLTQQGMTRLQNASNDS